MATCYDCIHCDACSDAGDGGYSSLKEDASKCKHFKNKADYAEVKHGEWENFEIPHMIRCSECGVSDLDIHRKKFDYCPYCGAKMDGRKDE